MTWNTLRQFVNFIYFSMVLVFASVVLQF